MPYKQGDIIIVPFPFTDLSGNKVRPAVVVSNDRVNRSGDVILVQITTQPVPHSLGFSISNADVTTPFKPPYSKMNISFKNITVINKYLIRNRITKLKETKLQELLNKIFEVLEKE